MVWVSLRWFAILFGVDDLVVIVGFGCLCFCCLWFGVGCFLRVLFDCYVNSVVLFDSLFVLL